MQIFNDMQQPVAAHDRGVALGFFDGVHHGHMELLRTLVFQCRQSNLTPAVFTFPNHPLALFGQDCEFTGYLTHVDERMQQLRDCGITETHLQPFDHDFARIEPLEFLDSTLDQRLHAKLIVVGSDYRFGHDGQGDIALLQKWASRKSIDVKVIPQVCLSGDKVSSTRIRELIKAGEMQLASQLLGRPYQITGIVVSGRKLGQQLGFPTANMKMPEDRVCPLYGVYATRTWVDDRMYDSITNIGLRPTVEPDTVLPLVETYLYDKSLDLYNKTITVEFLEMTRPEVRFASLLQLSSQISLDLHEVRDWHQKNEMICERARIGDVPLYWLASRRFAQSALSLVFRCPMEKHLTTATALLIKILTASCRRYSSRPAMATALDRLYGAHIEANQEKQGDMQTITFSAAAIRRWTDQSSPFADAVTLLFDLLLEPLLDDQGLFDAAVVEAERQNLSMEWLARENDRTKFAYDRCLEIICGDRPQGISDLGDRDILARIDRHDLKIVYEQMLSQMQLACYIGGAYEDDLFRHCQDALRRLPAAARPFYRPGAYPSPFAAPLSLEVQEEKALAQARIVMAFSGLPPYFSFQSMVVTMLNSMLGGDVHSLLFDVVREEMGLAYHVFSLNQRYLSLILMIAGVAPDKVESARSAMSGQLKRLADGDFPDQLLARARQMIETNIMSVNDNLGAMLNHQMSMLTHGRVLTVQDMLSMLADVQKTDIMQLAQRLQPSACYILTRHPEAGFQGERVSTEEDIND